MALTLDRVEEPLFEQGQTPETLPLAAVKESYLAETKLHPNHGSTWLDIVTMDDGTVYQVLSGMPEVQKTDVPILSTTAWLTSIEGHNTRALLHMLDAGIPTILVGPEGGHKQSEKPPQTYTLAQTANNMLSIANHATDQHPHSVSADKLMVAGDSRGAMAGFGVVVYSPLYGRQVVYADLVAPCFAEALDKGKIIEFLKKPHLEPWAVGQFVLRLSLPRLAHYPQSINLNPHYLKHAWAARKTIFSDEAGQLAKQVPTDTFMHIEVFMDDLAGQGQTWQEIFANHPFVTVEQMPGSHLSLAHPHTLYRQEERFKTVLQL